MVVLTHASVRNFDKELGVHIQNPKPLFTLNKEATCKAALLIVAMLSHICWGA